MAVVSQSSRVCAFVSSGCLCGIAWLPSRARARAGAAHEKTARRGRAGGSTAPVPAAGLKARAQGWSVTLFLAEERHAVKRNAFAYGQRFGLLRLTLEARPGYRVGSLRHSSQLSGRASRALRRLGSDRVECDPRNRTRFRRYVHQALRSDQTVEAKEEAAASAISCVRRWNPVRAASGV